MKEEMSVEFAEDLGLIPEISGYTALVSIGPFRRDRYATNEEIKEREERLWGPFGFNREMRTVRVDPNRRTK
jgi:hypothetical protein